MRHLYLTLIAILTITFLIGCNPKGHFSKKMESIEEPQTDDERTLVGEYNDYLAVADSLADVWDGKDTLAMRRLYYNQCEQERRINKVKSYQNIRRSLVDAVDNNLKAIKSEIEAKFSPEIRSYFIKFHECFDLKRETYVSSFLKPQNIVSSNIYVNSYGEHYIFIKEYDEGIVKQPMTYNDISWFKEFCKRYHITENGNNDYIVGDGSPTRYVNYSVEELKCDEMVLHEESETDWEATEIDWCEECANKNYSCCPKCKDGEKEDCACGCEACHDIWEYHNI